MRSTSKLNLLIEYENKMTENLQTFVKNCHEAKEVCIVPDTVQK